MSISTISTAPTCSTLSIDPALHPNHPPESHRVGLLGTRSAVLKVLPYEPGPIVLRPPVNGPSWCKRVADGSWWRSGRRHDSMCGLEGLAHWRCDVSAKRRI